MYRILISVPHSGTRTLFDALGINHHEQGLKGGKWWHFDSHDALLRPIVNRPIDHEIHIPIRYPMDVAKSWASRDKTGKVIDAMLRAFDLMFELIEGGKSDNIVLHRVEDYPRLKGIGAGSDGEWVESPSNSRIREFQAAAINRVLVPHRAFYENFYPTAVVGGDIRDR